MPDNTDPSNTLDDNPLREPDKPRVRASKLEYRNIGEVCVALSVNVLIVDERQLERERVQVQYH